MGVHYGHIGGMFRSAVRAENGELVGIVEPNDALLSRYTEGLTVPRYASLDEMLSEARPELVLEGLNHDEKVGFIEACARAGAHMLLDKPLCRTLDEWERIRVAVDAHGVRLSMFFTSRSHPPFMALREAVLGGELGEIVSLISTHPHKLGASMPSWYFDPSVYAGTFHDLACHGVDQVLWLTGSHFTGVHALGACKRHTTPPNRLERDHVQASFRLENGSCALLTADWLTPRQSPSFGDTRFILMGTEGSAHLRAYAENRLLIVTDAKGACEPELPSGRNDVFVQNMIDALERGEENFISTDHVLEGARACLAAEQSADSGGEFLDIG